MTVKVLVVDDHPMIRQGLRNLFLGDSDYKVIGEAGDGIVGLEMVDRCHPEVLIVDIMMPGLNGLEVIRQAKKRQPGLKIIVLSMQNSEPYVAEAFKNGASGYVLKDAGPSEIIQAINDVMDGKHFLSPFLSERMGDLYLLNIGSKEVDTYEMLTNREREVFQLAAEGYTSVKIAARLTISPRTVELYRAKIMEKLGLHHQNDLVRYAIRRGILSLDFQTPVEIK
jgi:two-component system, NarL family, response regulator NreC